MVNFLMNEGEDIHFRDNVCVYMLKVMLKVMELLFVLLSRYFAISLFRHFAISPFRLTNSKIARIKEVFI